MKSVSLGTRASPELEEARGSSDLDREEGAEYRRNPRGWASGGRHRPGTETPGPLPLEGRCLSLWMVTRSCSCSVCVPFVLPSSEYPLEPTVRESGTQEEREPLREGKSGFRGREQTQRRLLHKPVSQGHPPRVCFASMGTSFLYTVDAAFAP